MGLKQSIVVINEFTNKSANAKSGAGVGRGNTPGDYVLRYMSRDGAVETILPVCKDDDDFLMRYHKKKKIIDDAIANDKSIDDVKKDIHRMQGLGGVAFGYGSVSLSDEALRKAAKDIQDNFDEGKTVLKTVLSFDEDYLKENKIIDNDFEFIGRGDYKGNIDQVRLRMAIMNGVEKLEKYYDDLQYIGVIQVDTEHVHCHLAMVDRGEGNITSDGTQKGKLNGKQKAELRRGVDSYLGEYQNLKIMTSDFNNEKQNTTCFVKKYAHECINKHEFTQFLLSCLPDNKDYWTADSNRKEMRKPNAIVRDYVKTILDEPDSGYDEALRKVDMHARRKADRNHLSEREYRELYSEGKERVIKQAMNAVYSVMKDIPDEYKTIRTPMMDAMSMPYEEMASKIDSESDPMFDFSFKLRSYKNRLDHHIKEKDKYHNAVSDYIKQRNDNKVTKESLPLFNFYREEEEYNLKLMAKYQYFLKFVPPDDVYQDELDEIIEYDKRLSNLKNMSHDKFFFDMSSDEAEQYGLDVYNEPDGKYVSIKPRVISDKIDKIQNELNEKRQHFKLKLENYGMTINSNNRIQRNIMYDFDSVKSLDLHHMLYDFSDDFEISMSSMDSFIENADIRYESLQRAKDYLIRSGQGDALKSLPESDIMLQHSLAERFRHDKNNVFYSVRNKSSDHGDQKHVAMSKEDNITSKICKTVPIDYDFEFHNEENTKNIVKNALNDLQY